MGFISLFSVRFGCIVRQLIPFYYVPVRFVFFSAVPPKYFYGSVICVCPFPIKYVQCSPIAIVQPVICRSPHIVLSPTLYSDMTEANNIESQLSSVPRIYCSNIVVRLPNYLSLYRLN